MIPETFHIERFFAAHEFSTPHLLAVSDCESMTVGELLDLEPDARAALEEVWLGYTPSEGGLELREAVAATVPGLGPGDVLVHAAGVEVILTLAHAVLGPGDHAVVQSPCYQALRSAPAMAGAEVTLWEGEPGALWDWDVEGLESLLRPTTRLLVVNSPHNPTGHVFTRAELVHLAELCDARGIQLFVDEAYRGTERPAEVEPPPSITALSDTAAALGLLSKSYGLPGLRLGWLTCRSPALLEAAGRVKDFTTICAPATAEFLGALALRHHRRLLERTRSLLRRNAALLTEALSRHPDRFEWHDPGAGSVGFPLLRRAEADEFCRRARGEAGVLLAPSSLFGGRAQAIRVGYGRAAFPRDLQVFEGWLASV